jgi:hypothetical protein
MSYSYGLGDSSWDHRRREEFLAIFYFGKDKKVRWLFFYQVLNGENCNAYF